eukprot:m.58872 g.58872  ORF g.58872 m.58872 type:complete len:410 (-) comp6930_c0_seq2:65-1294(-)
MSALQSDQLSSSLAAAPRLDVLGPALAAALVGKRVLLLLPSLTCRATPELASFITCLQRAKPTDCEAFFVANDADEPGHLNLDESWPVLPPTAAALVLRRFGRPAEPTLIALGPDGALLDAKFLLESMRVDPPTWLACSGTHGQVAAPSKQAATAGDASFQLHDIIAAVPQAPGSTPGTSDGKHSKGRKKGPASAAASGAATKKQTSPGDSGRPVLKPLYRAATAERHAEQVAGFTAATTTLLVGDSIIERLVWFAQAHFSRETLVLAKGGDRIEHLLWRLQETPDSPTIARVVLIIGTNNLGGKATPTAIATGIAQVVTVLRVKYPAAAIDVLPLYNRASISPSIISEVNSTAQADLAAAQGVTWRAGFWDGLLPSGEYDASHYDDEVHLNLASYRWFEAQLKALLGQ